MDKIAYEGLTYDDVLLIPRRGSTMPRDVSTATRFCRGVGIQIPISSAAMDTVTDAPMAIALALQGGRPGTATSAQKLPIESLPPDQRRQLALELAEAEQEM